MKLAKIKKTDAYRKLFRLYRITQIDLNNFSLMAVNEINIIYTLCLITNIPK